MPNATDADAEISLEYLQNTMKMEQAVFDQPSESILTVDDWSKHDGY